MSDRAEAYAKWLVSNQDKAGTPEFDTVAAAYKQLRQTSVTEQPFGRKLDSVLGDMSLKGLGRQAGLTGRYALQGVGDVLDFLASPIRTGMNALGANIQGRTGEAVANLIGLPQPQGPMEETVGKATEFGFGSAIPLGSANKLKNASGVTGKVAKQMAEAPAVQVASAASAGGAGEYVKQTEGTPAAQFIASVAGGLAPSAAVGVANKATTLAKTLTQKSNPQQIDITIQNIIDNGDYGIQFAQVAGNVRNQLREDVKNALKAGGKLDEAAMRRLVDYRLVGATPTRGSVTLDPVLITQERNLAKMGANTNDEALQRLAQIQNQNNQSLIGGLNSLGVSDDAYGAGQQVISALDARNQAAKDVIGRFYDAARASTGRSVELDGATFTRNADDLLRDGLLQGRLPADVRNHLNDIAQGKVPFTVDYAEQLKTLMGNIGRSPSTDDATRMALGKVREALDSTPAASGLGEDAISAFNKAREVNRGWMSVVDKTPALQAIRDGVEPDKFVQQFIIGSGTKASVMDVAQLKNVIKDNKPAMDAIRGQIVGHLKSKALNGAADEVGNFSQSAFNKALNDIGERKLRLFFSPEEIAQIKAIGRVASYEQVQPRGSAVNNSNSGAMAVGNLLDFMANNKVLSMIPFAEAGIRTPARNALVRVQTNQATNVTPGLLSTPPSQPWMPPLGLLMAPAATTQQ